MKNTKPAAELFASRDAALDAAIDSYLRLKGPAAELHALHAAFAPSFTRSQVNKAVDRLAAADKVAFVPTPGAKVLVVSYDAPIRQAFAMSQAGDA